MTTNAELVQERVGNLTRDLRDSTLTRKQNFHALITVGLGGKVVKTYCAIGALGCEKKLIGYGVVKAYKGNDPEIQEPEYHTIINSYGLSDTLKHEVVIGFIKHKVKKLGLRTHNTTELSNVITTLNDDGHYKFDEVADYIDQLSYTGVIQTCSKKLQDNTNKYLLETVED